MKREVVLVALLLLCCAFEGLPYSANASVPGGRPQGYTPAEERTDSVRAGFWLHSLYWLEEQLDLRDGRQHHDTLFLERRREGVRLRVALNAYGSALDISGVNDDSRYKSSLEAQNKYTVSFSAYWRGLSASIALNPARYAGKNKDFELTLNAYGNRLGADIVYQTANTFRGDARTGDVVSDVSTGMVGQDLFVVNAYYTFSGRRFSYPAAFGQSWKQKASCGSWMLGASFLYRNLDVEESFVWNNESVNLRTKCFALGAGYGYNFVLRHGWLLHISALPELVVYNRSHLDIGDDSSRMATDFPEIMYTGRMGVSRNFSRYFMGLYSIVSTSDIGDKDRVRVENVKWQACLFFGIQL